MDTNKIFPKWLQELKRFQALKSEFFLYGNVYDCYYFPDNYLTANENDIMEFSPYDNIKDLLIEYFLRTQDFDVVAYFDIIDGINVESNGNTVTADNITTTLGFNNDKADVAKKYLEGAKNKNIDDAISFYRELMGNSAKLSAGIVNFTSRFVERPDSVSEEVSKRYIKMIKAAQESVAFENKNGKRNILIFICDKLNDIPAWILLENPLTKGIEIQKPNREERIRFFEQRNKQFFIEGQEPNLSEVGKSFPDLTENFSNRELENLITISRQEKLHISKMKEIIDLYKYGERDNPWEKITDSTIENATNKLGENVKGQSKAISTAVKIIKRAKLGLNAIDKKGSSNKPKGILFFAGPTGTGKTELAKSLANLLFSDKEAMIRFDMSEYNDSNSDVKLIGSPPGYVGYEEGGQLTDAIRKKPFSIVLFDEIEKAHPKIFDKFLQILDDGRLTDGKGETAFFSEAIIIFTSNLGIFKKMKDENGKEVRVPNVKYGEEYSSLESKIMLEIKNFFNNELGRPEIYNRFGSNFVVFDFINEEIAKEIIEINLSAITENLRKQKTISLEYDSSFISEFLDKCIKVNLENGGRGIVNKIEEHIKNELPDFMYATQKFGNCNVKMKIIDNKVVFE